MTIEKPLIRAKCKICHVLIEAPNLLSRKNIKYCSNCKQIKDEYNRQYHQAHKDKINESKRAYYRELKAKETDEQRQARIKRNTAASLRYYHRNKVRINERRREARYLERMTRT